MGKYAVLIAAVLLASGCAAARQDRAAAGGTASTPPDVQVRLDRDQSIQTFNTDFNLRRGDRVRVMENGKVAPL